MKTPPFYIGETVEYITGINMPKGTRVNVTDVFPVASEWAIKINVNCDGLNVWRATSFRSIRRFPLIKFAQIREVEKVEQLCEN